MQTSVTISGYRICDQLCDGRGSTVYRAHREADSQSVVLKVLKPVYPPPERIAWFRREYEITQGFDLSGVVTAYDLHAHDHRWVMVLEDFGAISLDLFMQQRPLTLVEFLSIAVQAVEILGQIHQQNILHKDVNPSNMVWNPTTGQLKLIDFGIAALLSREMPILRNPNVLEGTLPYISPEQTGRMNRPMDYRTDFYSLGASFYRMLTGQVPFDSADPMELVHCHIARQPVPPHQIDSRIPVQLSNLVMKLLGKTSESRYQSSYGLKMDLDECLRQLQETEKITTFPLAQHDVSERFQVSQRLYGRENEVQRLMAGFDQVMAPAPETEARPQMALVLGYPGIGKSVLVQEIYRPITLRRGHFISGKFDQFQRSIPYSAVTGAFQSLVQQLLGEHEVDLNRWREALLEALGPNGQVIIDVIPEVELIISPQEETQTLGPAETRNRFNRVFLNFVRVFADESHPLIIFLDDLQWVDSASLELLELLMTSDDLGHLYLIGAYRDNEVGPTHPLTTTLGKLESAGTPIEQIALAPLAQQHITDLIADTLGLEAVSVTPLAQLVMRKTGGNPFFVNEFLKTVYQDRLLTLDLEQGRWLWDAAQIEQMDITDNVVDLMVSRLMRLPEVTQHVLRLASCIGSHFDLSTLSVISELPIAETYAHLLPAIEEGFILVGSALEAVGTDLIVHDCSFLHDRVQQAAYALIAEADRGPVHVRIGRRLLANMPAEEHAERVFDIADQFNQALDLITDEVERKQVAHLDLEAGQKAKVAMAYDAAREYLIAALELLPQDSWESDYGLTLAAHKACAEAEYLSGHYEQSEALFEIMLTQAESPTEKAQIHGMQLLQHTMVAKYPQAIEAGRTGLSLIGIELPRADLADAIAAENAEVQRILGDREIASLYDLPEMTDPHHRLAMALLTRTYAAAFYVDPELYSLMVLQSVRMCLEHGNCIESSTFYVFYGHLLSAFWGDYVAGEAFGALALRLSEKHNNLGDKCTNCFVLGNFLKPWVEHIRAALPINEQGFQAGLEAGQLQFAGYILIYRLTNQFYEGQTLAQAWADGPAFLHFNEQAQNQVAIDLIHAFQMIITNLTGLTSASSDFSLDGVSDEEYLATWNENQSFMAFCLYHVLKSQVLYLYGQPTEALRACDIAAPMMASIAGLIAVAEHNFYMSLSLAALCEGASPEKREVYWERLNANQQTMGVWAEHCPENFHHMYALVAAEMARVSGDRLAAIDLYDEAIQSAETHGFAQDEALANELTAKFWLAQGKQRIAQAYLRDAYYGYQLWGAQWKVHDLEEQYPTHLMEAASEPVAARTATSTATTDQQVANTLDLSSILSASHTISGEIVLERLLERLMQTVIENAGAQKGFLILENNGALLIEASREVDQTDVAVLQSMPIEDSTELSEAIVHYVARARKEVVLDHAATDATFASDPYIAHTQPQSVLCLPLITQGRLSGILYLENNLTTGAFTPDRVNLLRTLSSQAAISIENARLYTGLAQSERRYRTLFEDSRDAIFITTPSGEMADFNQATLDLFGYSREDLIQRSASDLYVDPNERLTFQQVIEQQGSVRDFEVRLCRQDRTPMDCLLTATVRRDADGRAIAYQGIIRDITERKRVQQVLADYNRTLENEVREKTAELEARHEQAMAELQDAHDVQMGLMPEAAPEIEGIEIAGRCLPAKEVTGDFFDYLFSTVQPSRVAIVVADVTGKAMRGAMNAVLTDGILHMASKGHPELSPSGILREINETLEERMEASMFVTMVIGRFDASTRTLTLANAGHHAHPMLLRDGEVHPLTARGMPLGMVPGIEYREFSFGLKGGDVIVFMSDGILEARDSTDRFYGYCGQMESAIRQFVPTMQAAEMVDALIVDAMDFNGKQVALDDDITAVVVKVQ